MEDSMKNAITTLIIGLILVLVSPVTGPFLPSSTIEGPHQAEVDEIFADWNKPDTPGCAVAIIQDGKIIYKKGYGAANLDYNIPITPQTVFDIGSTSKQFTAGSIALLALDGKLSLDDDIRKYIAELPEYDRPITIRHLVHHTSGVRDYGTLWELAGVEDHNVYTIQDIVDICAQQKNLNFTPGDEHLYSNSGYILLAAVVERVSGMTLGEYAKKHIFEPLGMKRTLIYEDRTAVIKNRATGYVKNDKGGYSIDHYINFAMGGDGQVLTTVEDLFLWDQNFYHPEVGGQNFLDLIHTRGVLNNGKELDYAFGLGHGEYRGLKTVSHGGAWGGFRAQLIRVPEHRFSVAVLSNLGSVNPSALANRIIDIYLADHLQPKKKLSGVELVKDRTISVDPKVFDPYVGKYQLDIGLMFEVLKENNRLWIHVEGQPKLELKPLSETRYYLEMVDGHVTFIQDDSGRFTELILSQGGRDISGKRIEASALTPEQLKDYCGEYYSNELRVAYKLFLDQGKLHVQIGNKDKIELNVMEEDVFAGSMFKGTFERNAEGQVIGFSLDAGRVKNLKFSRKTQ
jgi:CubicO group peptidase (beta-lactamase class C family)